ncbi:hypothetical protein [Microvirga sp. CF3016]|jgi:hypothetical protein|uniref:hypothetical protein n=1 Tax=Microvirga sp. CF3016 TaxID=3110181 RepID=UPI002E76522A|nr:hypothetical protein [Microvirga sp. CF3016]MEE1609968.1 hypothetical protein [Microvirga sp. CF3016]
MTRYYILKSIPIEGPANGDQLSTFDKLRGILEERLRTALDQRARERAELELKEFLKGRRKNRPDP